MVTEKETPAWRLIDVSYPSVHQNLALEEALARCMVSQESVPVIRMWRNPPSVIVGRFQQVSEEVDVEFCRENGLAVARRFSGGGAVFHDYGVMSLSIIAPQTDPVNLNQMHRRNSSIVLDMLARRGMKGNLASPNSIHVNGRKICGAAAAAGQGYLLWHASILISADTYKLERALAPSRVTKKTRSTRSIWHQVTTLSDEQGQAVNPEHVRATLIESCRSILGSGIETSGLLDAEEKASRLLYEGKYSSDDWNWNGRWGTTEIVGRCEGAQTTIAV